MVKQIAQRGFTLVEVMIVVVVLAILAAVAYPSYLEHMRKTKRAEAKSALMQAMMQQERHFTQNNTYTEFDKDDPKGFKTYSGENATSSPYMISGAECGEGIVGCVLITATINASSGFTDPKCGNLSLNSRGAKSADGTDGSAQCWK